MGLAESMSESVSGEKNKQMKLLSAITIAVVAVSSLFGAKGYIPTGIEKTSLATLTEKEEKEEISDFDKAVAIIKKYEGLHQPRHWPLVGYGHKVLPGEKYSRNKTLSEAEADALLRKDLKKNCAVFRQFGADSLLLGVLAYNIGSGATLKSSVVSKLKSGNRNIYENYIAHSRYRGKVNTQLQKRRKEEFEELFIKNPLQIEEKLIKDLSPISEPTTKAHGPKVLSLNSGCWGTVSQLIRNIQLPCISNSIQSYS